MSADAEVKININQLLKDAQNYTWPVKSFEVDWVVMEGVLVPKVKVVYNN